MKEITTPRDAASTKQKQNGDYGWSQKKKQKTK